MHGKAIGNGSMMHGGEMSRQVCPELLMLPTQQFPWLTERQLFPPHAGQDLEQHTPEAEGYPGGHRPSRTTFLEPAASAPGKAVLRNKSKHVTWITATRDAIVMAKIR